MKSVPAEYHWQNKEMLYNNATHVYSIIGSAPGLVPVMSAATMYSMVRYAFLSESTLESYMQVFIELSHFSEFESDLDFIKALVAEQNVLCLPGSVS